MSDGERPGGVGRRSMQILLVVVIACAAVGYLVGIEHGVPRSELAHDARTGAGDAGVQPDASTGAHPESVAVARSYAEVGRIGPGAFGGRRYTVMDLGAPPFDLARESEIDTVEKVTALEARASLRAYDGAPPRIPHTVDQMAWASCVSCHTRGLELGDTPAPLIPHELYANCQQCHVADSPLFHWTALTPNAFDGAGAPREGARAWTGAPPVVPHTTWMRQNCLGCHGPYGKAGIRTSHPGRQSCLQCHAPSAELNRFASTTAAILAPLPPPAPVVETEPVETPSETGDRAPLAP